MRMISLSTFLIVIILQSSCKPEIINPTCFTSYEHLKTLIFYIDPCNKDEQNFEVVKRLNLKDFAPDIDNEYFDICFECALGKIKSVKLFDPESKVAVSEKLVLDTFQLVTTFTSIVKKNDTIPSINFYGFNRYGKRKVKSFQLNKISSGNRIKVIENLISTYRSLPLSIHRESKFRILQDSTYVRYEERMGLTKETISYEFQIINPLGCSIKYRKIDAALTMDSVSLNHKDPNEYSNYFRYRKNKIFVNLNNYDSNCDDNYPPIKTNGLTEINRLLYEYYQNK